MTLQEFKSEAQRRGNYYDNSANAAEHWAKSWGLLITVCCGITRVIPSAI